MTDSSDKHPDAGIREIDEGSLLSRSSAWLSAFREEGFPWRKALLVVVLLGLLGAALYALRTVLTPIVLSLAIAYVLDPAVDWLEAKTRLGRSICIAILLGVIFVGVAGVSAALFPLFSNQVQAIGDKLPTYREAVRTHLEDDVLPFMENRLGMTFEPETESVVSAPDGELTFASADGDLISTLSSRLAGVAPTLTSALASVGNWVAGNVLGAILLLVNFLLIPVFTFYFLRDWDRLLARIRDLIPERTREVAVERFREVDSVLAKFLRGQLSVCLILAVLYSLGLWVLGCPMWLVVGLLAGIAFLIPYLGTAIGIVLAAALTLFHYGIGPSEAAWFHIPGPAVVWIVLWFGVVQLVESNVITPKIVGESVGLHPVVVIVAIIAGAEVLGFLGMLLAVPATAAGAVFVRASLDAYRNSTFYRTT